jgi:hypothetical protein
MLESAMSAPVNFKHSDTNQDVFQLAAELPWEDHEKPRFLDPGQTSQMISDGYLNMLNKQY